MEKTPPCKKYMIKITRNFSFEHGIARYCYWSNTYLNESIIEVGTARDINKQCIQNSFFSQLSIWLRKKKISQYCFLLFSIISKLTIRSNLQTVFSFEKWIMMISEYCKYILSDKYIRAILYNNYFFTLDKHYLLPLNCLYCYL